MNGIDEIPASWFLILSAILFSIGVIGVLTRKNGITIFMSIEIMINAVNLTFITYAREWASTHGLIFVFFIMAIAAAEAAIGLAIFIALFRHRETIDVDEANLMHW
ncbi:MAG TPA: NADH-quinone oxidoreductase subunit NuoK [Thermoanaerobaculia bacterium]|nr:NADH-quinone oxidoreductase subunit NuoK [Thermoanaerobaculia bacterium]